MLYTKKRFLAVPVGALLLVAMALTLAPGDAAAQGPGAPENLRCEYAAAPLGLDTRWPRLSWQVNDSRRGARQSAYRVLVATAPKILGADQGDAWDSGKLASAQSVHVPYAGKVLEPKRRYYWKVRTWDGAGRPSPWSPAAWWEMGPLSPEDWKAVWIAPAGQSGNGKQPLRSQCLRKGFRVRGKVARARVYATGLGIYRLSFNGRPVSEDVFAPGWTRYDKRIQYQTYDVTSLLRDGENAIGATLANGWWSGKPNSGGRQLMLLLQLDIEYPGGRVESITTDTSWKAHPSPVLEDTFYDGETYDARLEQTGWDGPGFDDRAWAATEEAEKTGERRTENGDTSDPGLRPPASGRETALLRRVVAQVGPPIRVTAELKARQVTEPAKGVYVYDFGQNASGRCRLKAKAPAGTRIRIRFSEELKRDGTLYTDNYRSAKATDVYICRGGGEEVWEPDFTYRGFRYAELTGYPGKPAKDALVSRVLHSAPPFVGEFRCSNPLLNAIQHNIVWGQRSNLHSVPTDCPQRDERLGWMGDAQIFAQTSLWNMDMAGFYEKWMRDITDSQSPEGAATDVSPGSGVGAPGWADAVTVVPWTVWQLTGDTRILEENYEGMKAWVEFMRRQSKGDLYERGGYGDWIAVVGSPPEPIGSAYYYSSTKLLSEMAAAVGKNADARTYAALAERIATAYNARHLKANDYTGGTQTAKILPLAFGITPPERAPAVANSLVQDIAKRRYHLSTGFLGTPYINPVLTQTGHHDVAYCLAAQETYPSWGYMVRKGATTIWELWNSDKAGPGMNSRNHFALGAVGRWFYEDLAGINPEEPGFRRIRIKPRPAGDLTWVEAGYRSVYGPIASEWRLGKGELRLRVRIPANTTARVFVPLLGQPDASISEGGKALVRTGRGAGAAPTSPRSSGGQGGAAPAFAGMEGDFAVFRVGAGSYHFTARGVGQPAGANLPAPPALPAITRLSDDFAGASLDAAKWEPMGLGLESAASGSIDATAESGALVMAGTTGTNYWAGRTLMSHGAFTIRKGQKLQVDVERLAMDAKGTGARTGLWLWVDESSALLFAQDTEKTVWSYNVDGRTGSGETVAPAPDTGRHALRMVHDGEAVHLFLDGKALASVPVAWREGIRVGITTQARAAGDSVTARFDAFSAGIR